MPPRRSSRRRNQKKPRGRWGKDPDGREYHSEEDVEDEENDDESDDDNEFPQRTTKEKLIFLNVDLRDLEQAKAKGGLNEEFKIVKKRYYREALSKHPDKGGTERDFLELDVV